MRFFHVFWYPFERPQPPLHCTVSVGMAVEPTAPSCFSTLLGHADQAKALGRDRVVQWQPPG